MNGVYRYCPVDRVGEAACIGWHIVGPCPGHHGVYSFFVVWLCDCPMRWIGESA